MTRAHTAALVARLQSDELASCVYYDDEIPDETTNYLRVRTNRGALTSDRLTGPFGPLRKTYWLTGVGTSPGEAAWILEQATDVLLNWVPTVAGWRCQRMIPAASQPVDVDPDVDGRYFGVDQWDLVTQPVPA